MSESVRRRLRQIERVLGVSDVCSCGRARVCYVDADWLPTREAEPVAEVCPVCGLPVPTITIEYVSDWRAVGEPVR